MDGVTLIVSTAAIALAAVAYWRSGGRRDLDRAEEAVRRELREVRAKQVELLDHASEALTAAYDRSRGRLRAARERLARLQDAAVDGLEAQLKRANDHLEALTRRLDHAASSARDATVAAAKATERGIARGARRVHARVVLLEAKAKARLAQRAASDKDFDRADARLSEASELLAEARTILDGDDAFDVELDRFRDALRDAASAVRARAEDTRRRIDQVLVDADLVVSSLEAKADQPDDTHAAAGA